MDLNASPPGVSGDRVEKDDPDASMSPSAAVMPPKIPVRTMTGTCHSTNRKAIDWSPMCGLLAYGSRGSVVVVDPVNYRIVQCLDDRQQSSNVVRVAWTRTACTSKHQADRLTLASAHSRGQILVWNVKSGEVKARLQEPRDPSGGVPGAGGRANVSSPVLDMAWMDGSFENSGHLLLALHQPNTLILWDSCTGLKVWKQSIKVGGDFLGFSMDQFNPHRIILRSAGNSMVLLNDFQIGKAPSGSGKQFRFHPSSPEGSASASSSDVPTDDGARKLAATGTTATGGHRMQKMRNKVMEFVTMAEGGGGGGNGDSSASECVEVQFHRSSRDLLLVVFPRQVLVFDVVVGQVVATMGVEKGGPGIAQALPCRQTDAVYLLHDNGSVSLRVAAAAAAEDGREELSYQQRAHSEPVRLVAKNAKMLGMAVDPIHEDAVVVLSSEGKLTFSSVDDGNNNYNCSGTFSKESKLHACGVVSPLGSAPFVARMCPALTVKNIADYRSLMALGLPTGNIQVVDVGSGRVEREFATHTHPVMIVEWTGLHSLLSCAHQNLVSNAGGGGGGSSQLVRNEIVHTDVRTGKSTALQSNRAEEQPVDMIKVSHLKQYFIVAFADAPFELWDLRNLQLLRTMPRKFPPVTALDWSPLHNLKHLRKQQQQQEKGDGEEKKPDAELTAKEHFVFTDPEGQLYHFSVEGNSIRDGAKLAAQHGLSTVTYIVWKSDYIVRADAEGNINLWEFKTKASRNFSTRRGAIKRIRFAPGRGNMKLLVLHYDAVGIWDVKEGDLINELRFPQDLSSRPVDVDWASSDRPVIATADGCLRVMSLALSSSTSPLSDMAEPVAASLSLLPNKTRLNVEASLHHRPWSSDSAALPPSSDGFSPSELSLFVEMLAEAREMDALERRGDGGGAETVVRTNLAASRLCGMTFAADFWQLCQGVLFGNESAPCDLSCADDDVYLKRQTEKLSAYEARLASSGGELKNHVVNALICMGSTEKATKFLLDSADPSDENFYADSLRACLVSSRISDPESTVKLVATNLVAEGRLWEGIQMLCLIGKVPDACQYLQSSGEWDASAWLAKCRLKGDEKVKALKKWCDHQMARGRLRAAVLVLLSIRDHVAVLDALLAGKMVVLAAQFLVVLEAAGLLPDTSHAMVVAEDVNLAFARHMFDCGNAAAAFFHCDRADEKGAVLRREFEALLSADFEAP